jgi:FtsP/CotA-like multicopper oxidase with cupredoxin domain
MRWILTILLLACLSLSARAETVRYQLTVTQNRINVSGKKSVDFALLVNGGIPAPTLTFKEGDEAEIVVMNHLSNDEVSIHWHGILLPNEMDGVPYVTTPPIHPGQSYTFRFPIRQSGTYWYHSHTNVQEQKGVYGAFIIQPKEKTLSYDREAVLVVSDWSDEDAKTILRNLKKDGDYYQYKKNSVRSIWGALRAGELGTYFYNEWTRMGGMDHSDVGYEAFLINGKRAFEIPEAKPGEKWRLRIINAAASTYFYVALGESPMQVVSADGLDIRPTQANEILIGMAETYDLLFEIPKDMKTEFKATAQDGTGSASAWIGSGEKVPAPTKPRPDLYAPMDHGAHAEHDAHAHHHMMNDLVPLLTVDEIMSPKPTIFPSGSKTHDLKLVLDGDMERYIWHINGKAIHEERNIVIREGEIVRFTFENRTMMHHPMHLHGHFFRVLNRHGDASPLKHTVDVPPHGTRTIEFFANEPGEWMLHCHNLFHLKTGMARVVKYMTFTPKPEVRAHQKHDPHEHDHLYFYGMLEAVTNHGQGRFRLSQTWNELDGRVETRKDNDWDVEGDVFFRRWLGSNFSLQAGYMTFDELHRGAVGFGYRFPMLIHAQFLIDHLAKFRIDAEKRFQWTSHLFSDADLTWRQDHGMEYEVSLMIAPNWNWALGAKFTGNSFGGGVQFQF